MFEPRMGELTMEIAVIAPSHLPAQRANTLQVMKMAQAMVELGYQAEVAAPGAPPSAGPESLTELAHFYGLRSPVKITWLPAHSRLRRYDYAGRAIRWARRGGARLVYTRLPQAAALASQLGMPVVLEVHDLPQGKVGPWMFRSFLSGRGARRLAIITQALSADLQERFRAPACPPFTIIAPDGVDLERYRDLPGPEGARAALIERLAGADRPGLPGWVERLSPARFTAGYTGSLYAGRGFELLLDLAGRLPAVTFLIAGGSAEQVRRMQSQAEARRLENVLLTGYLPNADLPTYQAACDVLLMPYQAQVAASSGGDIARYLSPLKVFEYLACGRPILSGDLPVLREVLNADNAVLLPLEDVNAWAAALQALQSDPAGRARLASRARQDAEQYSWKGRAARIFGDIPELRRPA